jgi:hypothetical protein
MMAPLRVTANTTTAGNDNGELEIDVSLLVQAAGMPTYDKRL